MYSSFNETLSSATAMRLLTAKEVDINYSHARYETNHQIWDPKITKFLSHLITLNQFKTNKEEPKTAWISVDELLSYDPNTEQPILTVSLRIKKERPFYPTRSKKKVKLPKLKLQDVLAPKPVVGEGH